MNWNDAHILFVYPSRSRPAKFREGLDSIKANLAKPEMASFVFTVDEDDPTLESYLEIYRENGVVYYGGRSNNKIHAVNRSMNHAPDKWEILVVMSDDMRFVKLGFDQVIRWAFADHMPNGGVLHFNDGVQFANCMTMSIMSRSYYELFGHIYDPSYESLWCDLEEMDKAKHLGLYRYMGDENIIFRHLHPSFGLAEYDEQYNRTEAMDVRNRDEQNYRKRKAVNFNL